jgi:hypothetical protein
LKSQWPGGGGGGGMEPLSPPVPLSAVMTVPGTLGLLDECAGLTRARKSAKKICNIFQKI